MSWLSSAVTSMVGETMVVAVPSTAAATASAILFQENAAPTAVQPLVTATLPVMTAMVASSVAWTRASVEALTAEPPRTRASIVLPSPLMETDPPIASLFAFSPPTAIATMLAFSSVRTCTVGAVTVEASTAAPT